MPAGGAPLPVDDASPTEDYNFDQQDIHTLNTYFRDTLGVMTPDANQLRHATTRLHRSMLLTRRSATVGVEFIKRVSTVYQHSDPRFDAAFSPGYSSPAASEYTMPKPPIPGYRRPLPEKGRQMMTDWFENNLNHPYPPPEVKIHFSQVGSLSKQQVDDWFKNARARLLRKRRDEAKEAKAAASSSGAAPSTTPVTPPTISA